MKIVLLAGKSESSKFLYNKLNKQFAINYVIYEEKVATLNLITSRVKKFGILKVINQILFQTGVVFLLKLFSKSRINEIQKQFGLLCRGSDLGASILLKQFNRISSILVV